MDIEIKCICNRCKGETVYKCGTLKEFQEVYSSESFNKMSYMYEDVDNLQNKWFCPACLEKSKVFSEKLTNENRNKMSGFWNNDEGG